MTIADKPLSEYGDHERRTECLQIIGDRGIARDNDEERRRLAHAMCAIEAKLQEMKIADINDLSTWIEDTSEAIKVRDMTKAQHY